MNRPDREMDPRQLSGNGTQRVLLSYLVRGIMRQVRADRIGDSRWRNMAAELTAALLPTAVAERSALGFVRSLAARFSVDLAGGDETYSVELWTPDWRMRWDRAVSAMDYHSMRAIIDENPALIAQFAVARYESEEDERLDHELILSCPEQAEPEHYVPVLPGTLIPPRSHRTVWTLLSPLAHGADEKSGNVTMFRRQWVFDALTGRRAAVPFLSGNAVRGMWRDMVFGRWLQLIGLTSNDLPPAKAHALLAGGSVDVGADTGAADPVARRLAREICPPWDLFAGCLEQQIMGGRARIHDATLVCRETAWQVAPIVAPGTDARQLAAMVPEAAECTQLRQGTRHAHRDLDESKGSQMLFNVEHLVPGLQMVHSLQLWGLDGASEVTQSCLADLLGAFAESPVVGAHGASGFGIVAFDPYQPSAGTPALPSATVYLDYVAEHRDAMREWALTPAKKSSPKEPAKGGRRARAS
jgi:hypothetical protein